MKATLSRIVRSAIDSRIFVLLASAATFVLAAKGQLRFSPDAQFYLKLARDLEAGRFSVLAVGGQANFSVAGFAALLAAVRTMTPQHWQSVMLAVNVVSAAVTAVLLVSLMRKATTSLMATVFTLVAFVGCYDVFCWIGFLLTDHVYTMISLVVFLLALRGVLDPDAPQRARRVKLWLATVVAAVARPVGVVLLPVVALTEWMTTRRGRNGGWRTVWAIVVVGGMAGLLIRAYYFQDMRRWPLHWMRPKLVELAKLEKTGEVMRDRREMFHAPPVTVTDHLMIEADRCVRFFQITSVTFSRLHNAIALVYYVPLYALMLLGIVNGLKSGDGRRRALVHTALLWLVAMDLFCGATNLDYDWRYRLPLMPQMILLAACGVEAVTRRLVVPDSVPVSATAPAH